MDELRRSLVSAERIGKPYEDLKDLWERIKEAIESEDDAVSAYKTFIYMARRYIAKQGSTDYTMVEELFDEVFAFVDECFDEFGDETIELKKNYAYFLYAKSKKVDKAREVLNSLLTNESDVWAWLEAISMERNFGDIENARRLFFKALDIVIYHPYDLFKAFAQFEREEGTLDELEFALEKIRLRAEYLGNQKKYNQKDGRQRENGRSAQNEHPQPIPSSSCTTSTTKRPHSVISKESDEKSKYEPNQPECTVYISNLHYSCSEQDIHKWFENIKEVRLAHGLNSKSNKGYAFVDFHDVDSAKQAIAKDNKIIFNNRKVFISEYNRDKIKGEKSAFRYNTSLEKNKLFLRNVHFDCTENEIEEFFNTYGRVSSVRIVTHKSGKPKGVAYVEFEEEQSASDALKADGSKLHKRKILVALSDPSVVKKEEPKPNDMDKMKQKESNFDETAATQRIGRVSRLMIPRSINKNSV